MTTEPTAPARPARRTWDIVLSIALLVVLVATAAVLGIGGAFLVMASDSCGIAAQCNDAQLSAGVFLAMFGPAVAAVIAVVSVVERHVRARLAFWPPLVGIGVAVLVWLAGFGLVFGSVPNGAA